MKNYIIALLTSGFLLSFNPGLAAQDLESFVRESAGELNTESPESFAAAPVDDFDAESLEIFDEVMPVSENISSAEQEELLVAASAPSMTNMLAGFIQFFLMVAFCIAVLIAFLIHRNRRMERAEYINENWG